MKSFIPLSEIMQRNNEIIRKNQKLLEANFVLLKRYQELSKQLSKRPITQVKESHAL